MILGIVAQQAAGVSAFLPYSWSIPGGDAQSGTGDWTMVSNSIDTKDGTADGFTGNCFFGGNFPSARARHIFYDIPSDAFSAVDTGATDITLEILFNTINTDGDSARFYFEYWDDAAGTGNYLGSSLLPPTGGASGGYHADVLTVQSITGKVPPGTRSLTFGVMPFRLGGTECSFYWEMNSLTLSAGTGHRSASLFSDFNVSPANAVLGWTVTTGTIAGSADLADWGLTWRYGGSQAALQYNRALVIPSHALAPIAAGTATARLRRAANQTNAGDRSRTYCEFLDAGNAVVATLQDAATPTAWGQAMTLDEFTIAVPTTAVSARMNFHFQRADGTVNDARVRMTEVFIEW